MRLLLIAFVLLSSACAKTGGSDQSPNCHLTSLDATLMDFGDGVTRKALKFICDDVLKPSCVYYEAMDGSGRGLSNCYGPTRTNF